VTPGIAGRADLVSNLRALIVAALGKGAATGIGVAKSKVPIPAVRGSADYVAPASSGGAGIASPLTEQSRETQTLTLTSDDNTVEIDAQRITKVTMLDANGREVVFIYAEGG
jgi:hypothetical protein